MSHALSRSGAGTASLWPRPWWTALITTRSAAGHGARVHAGTLSATGRSTVENAQSTCTGKYSSNPLAWWRTASTATSSITAARTYGWPRSRRTMPTRVRGGRSLGTGACTSSAAPADTWPRNQWMARTIALGSSHRPRKLRSVLRGRRHSARSASHHESEAKKELTASASSRAYHTVWQALLPGPTPRT